MPEKGSGEAHELSLPCGQIGASFGQLVLEAALQGVGPVLQVGVFDRLPQIGVRIFRKRIEIFAQGGRKERRLLRYNSQLFAELMETLRGLHFSRKFVDFGKSTTSGNSGFLFKFCLLATDYIIMFALKIHILSSRSTDSLWYRCHRQ